MVDPYFYRNHLARRYYLDHINLKHKDFAAWNHKIQLFYGLVVFTTAVSTLLFIGGLDSRFPSIDTSIFETFFIASLVVIVVFAIVVARGRRRFRELWKEQNGSSADDSRSGKSWK